MPTVLIVEDSEAHASRYQTAFSRYEVETICVATVTQAKHVFQTHYPLEAIVLDNEVIEDGVKYSTFELALWLRESSYTGLIVAASGSAEFINKLNRHSLADAHGPKFMAAALTLSLLGIPG